MSEMSNNRLLLVTIVVVVGSSLIGGLTAFYLSGKTAIPTSVPTPIPTQILSPSPSITSPQLPTKGPSIPVSSPSSSVSVDVTPPPDTTSVGGNYILADSSTRIIKESELVALTPWQLKVARNEIYARHGRAFIHKDLSCYFAKQAWYRYDPTFVDTNLTNIEKQNVQTILNYENKTASPVVNKDSGCQSN